MTFSTHNSSLFRRLRRSATVALLAAAAIPAVGGCQNRQSFAKRAYEALDYKRPAEPAMNPTGPEDEAMARRQWRQQEALYANLGVPAYANRFRFNAETSQNMNPYAGMALGPLIFIGQAIAFPFTFIRAAPFERETYRPFAVEPSFTANPARGPLATLNGQPTAGGNVLGAPGLPPATPALPGGVPPAVPGAPTPGINTPPVGVPDVNPTGGQPTGGGTGGGSTGGGSGGTSGGGAGGAGGK